MKADLPTVIIDTREQFPWRLDGVTTKRATLRAGDYSVEGLESRFAIERKSLADLVGTVIAGAERFEWELQQLAHMDRAVVIVEASLSDVLERQYRSRVEPRCVVGAMASIWARWGVPFLFAGCRADAEVLAVSLIRKAAKYLPGLEAA